MNKYTQQLEWELNDSGREVVFEIEVRDKAGESDWINCEIYFEGNSIVAERDAVSSVEERSEFSGETSLAVDDVFGLDEHIQLLYSAIEEQIRDGDLYDLAEEA